MTTANRTHLTLDDVDDIVELDRISARITEACDDYEAVHDRFVIGEVLFQKPSFARADLINLIQDTYKSAFFQNIGLLYALDCSRTQAEIETLPTRMQLVRYRKSIKAPQHEVERKLRLAFESVGSRDEEEGDTDTGRICAILSREVGGSVKDWYHATPTMIDGAIRASEEKIQAEISAMNKAGKNQAPIVTPKIRAISDFQKRRDEMILRWESENGG